MDYTTLQTHVKRNLGNRATDPEIPALVQDWLNSCYLDLVTMGKFPELLKFEPIPVPVLDITTTFNTIATIASVAVPATLMFPISLRDTTNNIPLKQRDIRWYDRNKSTVDGKPRIYVNFGGFFYFDPTPDAAYVIQLRYRKKVDNVALVLPTDVPIIGAEWHEALEIGATMRGFRSLGDPRADKWLTELKTYIISHSEQHTEEEEDFNGGFTISL